MNDLRYLAYGSNLHPGRLQQRIPAAEFEAVVRLDGWSLRFNKRSKDESAKCNLVRQEGEVHAAIYRLSTADRDVLDRIEGVGFGYEGRMLDLPDYGGCYTYLAQPGHVEEGLAPYTWYRDYVLAGCRYHGFPAAYVQAIEAIAARLDPNEGRHQEHIAALAALGYPVS